MSSYPLGSEVELFYTFTNDDGDPEDPTTVEFTVELPDETVETFTSPHAQITNPAVGEWILAYTGTQVGDYLYKAAGTAGLIAVSPVGSFTIVGDAITEKRSLHGPCEPWTTSEDVLDCCGSGTDPFAAQDAADAASEILYKLSAARYPGRCTRTVRPCGTRRCVGPWPSWNGVGWVGYWYGGADHSPSRGCGCSPLSRIPLAGHAISIEEVLIDGAVVDPDTYRLDENYWLTRVRDPADLDTPLYWPSCQAMDLPTTEEGTFEITYTYGKSPPRAGRIAAAELACAIHQTCAASGGNGSLADCPLPTGVVRIEQQGITIDLSELTGWAFSRENGWSTGLPLTDMFLNAYNPRGRRKRRSRVWSPDLEPYPRPARS